MSHYLFTRASRPSRWHCVRALSLLAVVTAAFTAEMTRLPVPTPSEVTAANQVINDILKDDFAKVRTVDQARAMASLLVSQATPGIDPAQRYALLIRARDAALKIADVEITRTATEGLLTGFAIETTAGLNSAFDLLERSQLSPENARLLTDWILDDAHVVALADRLPLAIELANRALRIAPRVREPTLITSVKETLSDYQDQKAQFFAVQKAMVVLESAPDDAAACTLVGSYHAFAKRDWKTALPLLAKGIEGDLRTAAMVDLGADQDGLARAKAGTQWLKTAESLKGMAKNQATTRAMTNWELALKDDKLPPFEQVKVQKYLERTREALAKAQPGINDFLGFARRLKLQSAGFDTGNRLLIAFDGKSVLDKPGSEVRGLTLAAWTPSSPGPQITSFDTFGSVGPQTDLLVKAIAALPLGAYVVIGAADAVGPQTDDLLKALQTLGSQKGVGSGFRIGYLLIGRKGLPPGQGIELVGNDTQEWPTPPAATIRPR